MRGKLRCNHCSKILTQRTEATDRCECGCRAFFASKITAWERLRFFFGIDRDYTIEGMSFYDDIPLGAKDTTMNNLWGSGPDGGQ